MPRLEFRNGGEVAAYNEDGTVGAVGHIEIDALVGGVGARIGDLVFVVDSGGTDYEQPRRDLQQRAAEASNVQ